MKRTRSRLAHPFLIGATGKQTISYCRVAAAHLPHSCTYDGHHFSDESEAAHWGLFLNNFTEHVLDTYGSPDKWALSAQARSVAAFLFGLRSHQVWGGQIYCGCMLDVRMCRVTDRRGRLRM